MAFHGVLERKQVSAMNTDSYNRSVVSAIDVDNGNVFTLSALSTTADELEVWTASTPVTGSLTDLWMACEPEVVTTVSGSKEYKGINPDIRDFYNVAEDVFSAFKPQIGDIVTLTAAALGGTISTNEYVVATDGTSELTWAAAAITGLSLQLIKTTYISIATGAIGSQRTTTYKFAVVAV